MNNSMTMNSGHSPGEVHSVRGYIFVFIALLAGTILTVWASFIQFGSREINIAVALVIASVKPSWWWPISCTSYPSGK